MQKSKNNSKKDVVTRSQKNIKMYWTVFKAMAALLVLSAGTVRTLVLEAQQNQMVLIVGGIAIVFFCISAIIEATFSK